MLTLDIATPDRRVIGPVKVVSITLPGALGEMTILPGHARMVSVLDTGVVKFKTEAGKVESAAISNGFVDVNQEHVTVLAQTLEMSHEIDLERAKRAQAKAQDRLVEKNLSPETFSKYQLKLQRSLVRQQISSGKI